VYSFRYQSLREDDFDHAARKEEEEKRGRAREIGFNYDASGGQQVR
jgi:hypothetical protein